MKPNDQNDFYQKSIIEMDNNGNILYFDEEEFDKLPDCHLLKSLGKLIKKYRALEKENNVLIEINLKYLETLQRLN